MATNIYNQFFLGKLGAMLFVRQTPVAGAQRHQGVFSKLRLWREQRAAQAELSALSDRELSDIGLTRQEIPAVVVRGQR